MPDQYNISVSIVLEANDIKKNAVRDWLDAQLQLRRADGTIISGSISIHKTVVPEQVNISPL